MLRTEETVGVLKTLRIVSYELLEEHVTDHFDMKALPLTLPQPPQKGAVECEQLV